MCDKHAQHAVANLFLKAIHHAQNNDECRHTQGNAQHGHRGNKRDKAVAPRRAASTGVAPAHAQLKGESGKIHAGDCGILHNGLSCPPEQGWAFINLVHWRVDQGQVHLHHPGSISAAEDQALLHSMSPYFLEDGIHLHAFQTGRWLAHSVHFKHLPSASLDQVMGRSMAAWLNTDDLAQQSDTQRLLRRLQNEMQMLLYTHAVNEQRAISLNSFWWSGTGEAPPASLHTVSLHPALRDAYLAQDPAACAMSHRAACGP
jgi:hypothetical protein